MARPTSRLDETDIDRILTAIKASRSGPDIRKFESLLRKIIQRCSAPVVRADEAHFFFESPVETVVETVGDWNGWKPGDPLEHLHPLSRFYHLRKKFPIDARLAYRFLLDGQQSILDPLNPHREVEVFGTNSVLRMPGYPLGPLAAPPTPDVPPGRMREYEVPHLQRTGPANYTRSVQVYLPANATGLTKLPVLYVHDGLETITVGRIIPILDNLFHTEPLLRKCIVVFIPPRERDTEYMLNESYAAWLAESLVPFVEAKLRLRPAFRGTLGASLGGLLAAQLGYLHSDVFSAIAMQSPAVWVQNEKIVRMYLGVRALPLRFFIHTGTVHDADAGSRRMLRVLQEKGYSVQYRESTESHNWGTWRSSYAGVIRWFGTAAE